MARTPIPRDIYTKLVSIVTQCCGADYRVDHEYDFDSGGARILTPKPSEDEASKLLYLVPEHHVRFRQWDKVEEGICGACGKPQGPSATGS